MNKPKILLIDIENTPLLMWGWALWDQNFSLNQIELDSKLMSFCAKWLDSEEVIYEDCRSTLKNLQLDDMALLLSIHKLLDEADFIVAHNGQKFDLPKIKARFCLERIPLPSPVRVIDTMKMAKSFGKFTSNKLEYLTDKLCDTHKKLTHGKYPGFEMWRQCLHGNDDAWEEMRTYNIADVLSMEELYKRLNGYATNTPNLAVFSGGQDEKHACPTCGGHDTQKRGKATTQTGVYQRYVCLGCRNWSRGKKNEIVSTALAKLA